MSDEKDRFGDTLKLIERAKEDIYFAEREREMLEKLRGQLRKVEKSSAELRCPKCQGVWESFTYVRAGSLRQVRRRVDGQGRVGGSHRQSHSRTARRVDRQADGQSGMNSLRRS